MLKKRIVLFCFIFILLLGIVICFILGNQVTTTEEPINEARYNQQKEQMIDQFKENQNDYEKLIDQIVNIDWEEGGYYYLSNDEGILYAKFNNGHRQEINVNAKDSKVLEDLWNTINKKVELHPSSITIQKFQDNFSVRFYTWLSEYKAKVFLGYSENKNWDEDLGFNRETINTYWYYEPVMKN